MINIKVSSGLADLQRELRSRLNNEGIRRVANEMANELARLGVDEGRRQLRIDAPGYASYGGLLIARRSRLGKASITLDRSDRKFARLLAAQANGGRLRIPGDIDSYLIRVDRRFGYRRLYDLVKAAHAGRTESVPGAARKVYVSDRIGDNEYALVKIPGSGIYLFQRFGRYKSVRRAGGKTRGQRDSRLIAFMPYSINITAKWQLQQAVARAIRRNEQRVFDDVFSKVARNRRYRAR